MSDQGLQKVSNLGHSALFSEVSGSGLRDLLNKLCEKHQDERNHPIVNPIIIYYNIIINYSIICYNRIHYWINC